MRFANTKTGVEFDVDPDEAGPFLASGNYLQVQVDDDDVEQDGEGDVE